jgi:hypothetical protein
MTTKPATRYHPLCCGDHYVETSGLPERRKHCGRCCECRLDSLSASWFDQVVS